MHGTGITLHNCDIAISLHLFPPLSVCLSLPHPRVCVWDPQPKGMLPCHDQVTTW